MDWIKNFDLFLFDFDGILADTERLHYKAYQEACRHWGYELPWSFERYSQAAHFEATGLRVQVYGELPGLEAEVPSWDVFYQKKSDTYSSLVKGGVGLMPGVEKLLGVLEKAGKKRCVVTHSIQEHVSLIREQNPILNSIPRWFTRGDYSKPKPDPECYLTAIAAMKEEGDRVVGFEDIPKGLRALTGTEAKAVWLNSFSIFDEVREFDDKNVSRFNDFPSIPASFASGCALFPGTGAF